MFIGATLILALLITCGGGSGSTGGDPNANPIISSSPPTIDVSDYGNLSTAIEAIGAAQTTLVISTPQILTENTTIPPNIGLVIQNGGTITKNSLYTLALNGPFEAGLYQVFVGFSPGDVSFGPGSAKEVFPEWWGIDGTTDDVAINAAITALSSSRIPLRLSARTYTLASGINITKGGVKIIGAGRNATILYAGYTGSTPAIQLKSVDGSRLDYNHLEGFFLRARPDNLTDIAIESDYTVGLILRDVFISAFGKTALNLLTTWEATADNFRVIQCGRNGDSTTGVINFGSSAARVGQCTQSNFSNIIMGSNYGTHFRIKNSKYGNSALHFSNVTIENNQLNNAPTDNNPLIDFDNAYNISFNNFAITINTKNTSSADSFFVKNGGHFCGGLFFSNGTVAINGTTYAPLAGVINFSTNHGDMDFSNVLFQDLNDKVPSKGFAVVTTGGTSRLKFNECVFNTALSFANLFQQTYCVEGTIAIERLGSYTRYVLTGTSP